MLDEIPYARLIRGVIVVRMEGVRRVRLVLEAMRASQPIDSRAESG